MRIYFGEDVRGPYVSLLDDGAVITTEYGEPREDIIAVMDRAFRSAKKEEVDEVAVDRGPGGFSAVRRRVAVATALAASLGVGIAGVGQESPEKIADLSRRSFSKTKTVIPLYDGEPNITKSKKDSYV